MSLFYLLLTLLAASAAFHVLGSYLHDRREAAAQAAAASEPEVRADPPRSSTVEASPPRREPWECPSYWAKTLLRPTGILGLLALLAQPFLLLFNSLILSRTFSLIYDTTDESIFSVALFGVRHDIGIFGLAGAVVTISQMILAAGFALVSPEATRNRIIRWVSAAGWLLLALFEISVNVYRCVVTGEPATEQFLAGLAAAALILTEALCGTLIIDHLFVPAALAGGWLVGGAVRATANLIQRGVRADRRSTSAARRNSLLIAVDDLFSFFRQLDTAVGSALGRLSRRRVVTSSAAALALLLTLGVPVKAQTISGPAARPPMAIYIVSDRTSSVPPSEFASYLTDIVPTMILPMVAPGDEVFSLTIPQGRAEYLKNDQVRLSHLTDFYRNKIVPLGQVKPNSTEDRTDFGAVINWVGRSVSDRLDGHVKPILVYLTDGEPAGPQQPVREAIPKTLRIFFIGVHPKHSAALTSFLDRNHLTGNVDLIAPFDGWQSYASVFANKVGRKPNTQLIRLLEVKK